MSDRDALYAAVLAAPADDLPRLLYADWCDDHGEPDRAEFIRVQCELARLPAADARRGPLVDRVGELLTPDNHARWRIPEGGLVQHFRRGFVESVYTNAGRFLELSDELFRLAPVRELRLSLVDDFLRQLCQVGELARLDGLELSGNWLGIGSQLERLLADAPLDGLQRLTIQDSRLFADAVGMIERSPVAPRLTHLDLSGNPLSEAGADALATTTRLRALQSLVLRNKSQEYRDSIHAAGAAALAASRAFPHLEALDLTGHHVGDAGLVSLVGSPVAVRLRELRLASNDVGETGDEWAAHLIRSLHPVTRLLDLSGRRNHVSRSAAGALAGWPRLGGGLTLDLRGCEMDGESHARLAASPFAINIRLDPREVSA